MNNIAHLRDDGTEQPLLQHLEGTAKLASYFAMPFCGEDDSGRAGMLHDIGKYATHFQYRIRDPQNYPPHDHATAGAQICGISPIAFAVAGHHGGLPDGGSRFDTSAETTLFGRLKRVLDNYSSWNQELELPPGGSPTFLQGADKFTYAFYTRMLFSCLVDADFIDTESFMQGAQPRGNYDSISTLIERLERYFLSWRPDDTPLNQVRTDIRNYCEKACQEPPGLFSLTVPTGGGKTLSSLRFALGHAAAHKMERIIYVIPYTSIIDQTAQVFKKIFGEDQVLEHHSSVDYNVSGVHQDTIAPLEYKRKLACENWDAPVIVTTAVQFFESLFADRPSKCRKLHNIANSVIIFDEAQTLPAPFLTPCVAAISQLVKHYSSSAVLCTATQPELSQMFSRHKIHIKEIIPNPAPIYKTLKRASVKSIGLLPWEELGKKIAQHSQVLCIVGRRKSVQTLFESLPPDGSYCLSTLLYPKHRKKLFEEIREKLKCGEPCRVISTSLIEAGVDLDFPAVYREKAGLDSILQAAGRCNREGKRPAADSITWFFDCEDGPTAQTRQNVDALERVLKDHEDISNPAAIRDYFEFLWYIKGDEATDKECIISAFEKGIDGCVFPFRQVANKFRLINSPAKNVYIPIGDGLELTDLLRRGELSRGLFRKLGQFGVTVYPDHMDALIRSGAVELLESGDAILCNLGLYDDKTGLCIDVETGVSYFL